MKYHLTPKKETLVTNIIERTIGRAVSVEPYTRPFGPATQDLLGDVFHALYNADMEPIDRKKVPSDRTINHALMRWMSQDDEFAQAREKTRGKLAHSMVSAKLLYEYLITDEAIRKALEVQEQEPPSGGSGSGEGDEDGDQDEMSQALKDALNKIDKLSKNVIGSKIMSLGAKKAEEESDKMDKAMKSWGVDPGGVNINDIDDIMNLVDRNDSKLQEIADLAGRFQQVAASALEKVRESYIGQVVDTKRTRDFNLMYGTELCYLMSPDVPDLIRAKYKSDYLEAGLLGVDVRSEGKDFGSIYEMVDGSGSMDGTMEVHAKAIALGLAKALNQDTLNNREYSLNTFGSAGDGFFSTNSKEDWKSQVEWARRQQGGGTDFDYAFNKAIRDIKEMPEGTDFVFITDGSCRLSEPMIRRWKEFREQTGTRLLYVDVSGQENREIKKLCDLYIRVDFSKGSIDFVADDIASKLAGNMETSRLDKKGDE